MFEVIGAIHQHAADYFPARRVLERPRYGNVFEDRLNVLQMPRLVLDPQIIHKSVWSEEEDRIILEGVVELGTRWSEIVKRLPGRSNSSIKNRYYSNQRKAAALFEASLEQSGALAAMGAMGLPPSV